MGGPQLCLLTHSSPVIAYDTQFQLAGLTTGTGARLDLYQVHYMRAQTDRMWNLKENTASSGQSTLAMWLALGKHLAISGCQSVKWMLLFYTDTLGTLEAYSLQSLFTEENNVSVLDW